MIHIENLLRPLQLFYFHLRPIYWSSPLIEGKIAQFLENLDILLKTIVCNMNLETDIIILNLLSSAPTG
jgi:hypothetical protein